MYKKFIYLFLLAGMQFGFLLSQNAEITGFVNQVFAGKTFEKQQDRHIYINDSLDRLAEYKKEFGYLLEMDKRCREKGNQKLLSSVLVSIGNFYISSGNYATALDTFNVALKLFEVQKNFGGQSTIHANMGNAYFYLHDLDKALFYYKLSVGDLKKMDKKENTDTRLANCYNSLGSIYCSRGDFVFGKTYFDLAYNIWKQHGDSLSMSYIFNNYAEIFFGMEKMDSAFFYFNKALGLKMRHGDAYDKADAHNNISDYYFKKGNVKEALAFALGSLNFLDTTIYSRSLIEAYSLLTEGYNKLHDYRNELKFYKKYKAAIDSSDLQGQKSEQGRKELRNEFDRIHLSDSIKAVEEIKLKDVKLSEKKQQTYFLIFILLLTVAVLALIYSRFKLTKKQKHIIEQKNKEITDSINYARKIQQSILPNEKYIEKELNKLNGRK